ncbi:MAG: RnfABCDGE type electron transport complex subunit G [Candidatus Sumerlaeia bacterium]
MPPAKEFSPLRMILTLIIICSASGVLLAAMQEMTKERIAAAKEAAKLEAVLKVLPKGVESTSTFILGDLETFAGFDASGKFMGVAIPGSDPKGYNGLVKLMIGMDAQGKLTGVQPLKVTETPGLGTKIIENDFLKQMIGKGPDDISWKVKKDGGSVDAVAGATISSRAAINAITSAFEQFSQVRDQAASAPATQE